MEYFVTFFFCWWCFSSSSRRESFDFRINCVAVWVCTLSQQCRWIMLRAFVDIFFQIQKKKKPFEWNDSMRIRKSRIWFFFCICCLWAILASKIALNSVFLVRFDECLQQNTGYIHNRRTVQEQSASTAGRRTRSVIRCALANMWDNNKQHWKHTKEGVLLLLLFVCCWLSSGRHTRAYTMQKHILVYMSILVQHIVLVQYRIINLYTCCPSDTFHSLPSTLSCHVEFRLWIFFLHHLYHTETTCLVPNGFVLAQLGLFSSIWCRSKSELVHNIITHTHRVHVICVSCGARRGNYHTHGLPLIHLAHHLLNVYGTCRCSVRTCAMSVRVCFVADRIAATATYI